MVLLRFRNPLLDLAPSALERVDGPWGLVEWCKVGPRKREQSQ